MGVRQFRTTVWDDPQVSAPQDAVAGGAPQQDQPSPANPARTPRHPAMRSTLVIEGDVIPRRLRRPADAFRLVVVIGAAATILGVAYFASSTASGLDQDIAQASNRIPHLLVDLANFISGAGVIAFPVAAVIDLLVRKQPRQLIEALSTMIGTLIVLGTASWLIQRYGGAQLLTALTGRPAPTDVGPIQAVLASIVAFVTVSRLMDRTRWAAAAISISVAIILANIAAGGITVAALTITVLLGWAAGLLARVLLGTPTTRPTGLAVAAALQSANFRLTVLRAAHETASGRRYSATTRSGSRLEILVLDRDLEGAGIGRTVWRNLRLRDQTGPTGYGMRHRLEHAALQSFAAQAAGAPVPRLEAVCEVGPDAALLAYTRIEGKSFAQIGASLTDADLDGAWRAMRTLHEANVSHRTLMADNVLRDPSGGIWLLNPEQGLVAASDVAQRIDQAELLCTLALLTSPERAVASGQRVLGAQRLATTLAVLQPLALMPQTRAALRRRKDILVSLANILEGLTPERPADQINLERLRPRWLLTIGAGTVAAYILLAQLGRVDLVSLLRQANWSWAALAVVLSVLTYIGATWTVDGFVPEKLRFWRTFEAQWAASFATLVSPPTLGAVAVNVRYLQRSGVHPALAGASVGVSQLFAFGSHILLLLGFAYIAGANQEVEVTPPDWALAVGAVLVVIAVAVMVLPMTRLWALRRIMPIFKQVGPRLMTLAQDPRKIATGVAGILILNLGYCACLIASVRAFGGGGTWAAIAVVYLAGAAIGQAAPTPGGVGAVEAALAAGLTAAGIDAGVAVSSTLLFRIFTFILPVIPGWFCFNNLQREGLL